MTDSSNVRRAFTEGRRNRGQGHPRATERHVERWAIDVADVGPE
jgi:hypothetical protein